MSACAFKVAFGPVIAAFRAEDSLGSILAVLKYWLSAGVCASNSSPSVTFEMTAPGPRNKRLCPNGIMVGHGRIENDLMTLWDQRAWEANIDLRSISGRRHWSFHVRNGWVLNAAQRVPTWLLRLAHHHYFSCDEIRASTFLYRHLIPIVQMELLSRDATFIHASAVEHVHGGGMLISGWGGAGKTSGSSALYAIRSGRWRFMGDDLSIIDRQGTLHFSPLALNVFPYNTSRFEKLHHHLISRMGRLERAHWKLRRKLLGDEGVVRRIPPFTPKGGSENCQLLLCVHLQRSKDSRPKIAEFSPGEFARVAKSVLVYELRESLSSFALANSFLGAGAPVLPPDVLAKKVQILFTRALGRSRILGVNIPESYGPSETGQLLEALWKEEC